MRLLVWSFSAMNFQTLFIICVTFPLSCFRLFLSLMEASSNPPEPPPSETVIYTFLSTT